MPGILKQLEAGDLFEIKPKQKTELEIQQEKDLLYLLEKLYPGQQRLRGEERQALMPDITKVLSYVEHLCFYNVPAHPVLHKENLNYLRHLIMRAITEFLLEYQLGYDEPGPAKIHKAFIRPIKKEIQTDDVTIITTNYDLSVDMPFQYLFDKNKIDYGIEYRDVEEDIIHGRSKEPALKYYKLHGSLNWLQCDLCNHYYINPYGSIAHQPYRENTDANNTCFCNHQLKLQSVLVAPSVIRDIRDSNLLQIWRAATDAIRLADKIVFVGYSLPDEDFAIQTLISRGINGRNNSKKPEIIVVQHGDVALPKYQNLFGKKITYISKGLEEYLGRV